MPEGSASFLPAQHPHHHRTPSAPSDPGRPPHPDLRKPVTLIAGFLGAGKTTLINHILDRRPLPRTEVIVREYGEIGFDQELIATDAANILLLPSVSNHFVDPQTQLYWDMERLYSRCDKRGTGQFTWQDVDFDRVLLETSGLDIPELLAELFFLERLRDHYRLDAAIVVVDAEFGELNLDEYRRAREQVAFADVLLVNKVDCAETDSVEWLERRLRRINALARVIRTEYTRVDCDRILNVGLFDGISGFDVLSDTPSTPGPHANGVSNVDEFSSLVLTETRPLDKERVNAWIKTLLTERGYKILRGKGFLNFAGTDQRFVFQSVRRAFHSRSDRAWRPDEARKSVIILIGEGLDDPGDLQQSFSACAQ